MENLRDVIKATFKYVDITTSSLFKEDAAPLCLLGDKKRILSDTLRRMRVNKTLDQIGAVVDLSFDSWYKSGDDVTMQYSECDSVFNLLLHFTSRVLALKNGLPVCRYKHFLRWTNLSTELGEDIFVTSYLAAKDCRANVTRTDFIWDENIGHDNNSVNAILNRELSDLHAHLKGSSSIFYLNWLCLMNHIGQVSDEHICRGDAKVLMDVVKACAIRYYLSMYLFRSINDHDNLFLKTILLADDLSEVIPEIDTLQIRISAYSHLFAGSTIENARIDYNFQHYGVGFKEISDKEFLFSVFSGERAFMYKAFQYIYLQKKGFHVISRLFYAYLYSKVRFRSYLIQSNEEPGFGNFSEFQDRKSKFILKDSIYDKLVSLLAVGSFLSTNPTKRYLETRVTPKNKASKLNRSIARLDEDIRRNGGLLDVNLWQYNYVLHFIKLRDDATSMDEGHCRHYRLRTAVSEQARAIYNMRYNRMSERSRVVGIDAANSELDCRPEVFAQAYRYLRCHSFESDDYRRPPDLGFTFHVGEDYYDIVDGLRAVDEVINYMNFTDGDRLGHALVLGENVKEYYSARNMTVVMPKQVLLDNVVWLYMKSGELKMSHNSEMSLLRCLYEDLLDDIYGGESFKEHSRPTIFQYYQSWFLRGDNPFLYSTGKYNMTNEEDRWSRYGVNLDERVARVRSNDIVAQRLYFRYHFDPSVKSRGMQRMEYKVIPGLIEVIDEVREMMLTKVESLHLSIECNPTSNYKIGALPRYAVHPIVKFFNYQLGTSVDAPNHAMNVSINTDDKGVFATSLEREYSIMAAALEKQKDYACHDNPRQIYDWLDRVRELGEESHFNHLQDSSEFPESDTDEEHLFYPHQFMH